jgi:HSF-type DNA-binding
MFFEHSKFSSFIRQANGWGFRRMVKKGPDLNSYYHEIFLRGNPHLIKLMKRPTITVRPPSDARTEPDFYKIAEERPLPEASPSSTTNNGSTYLNTRMGDCQDDIRESKNEIKETNPAPPSGSGVLNGLSSHKSLSPPPNHKKKPVEPMLHSSSSYSTKHLEPYQFYETPRKFAHDERVGRAYPLDPTGRRTHTSTTNHPWTNRGGLEDSRWRTSHQRPASPLPSSYHVEDTFHGDESLFCIEPIPFSHVVSHSVLHPVSPGGGSWSSEQQKGLELKFLTKDMSFPIGLWPSDELW